jgi:hypothetical protein
MRVAETTDGSSRPTRCGARWPPSASRGFAGPGSAGSPGGAGGLPSISLAQIIAHRRRQITKGDASGSDLSGRPLAVVLVE